MPGVLQTLHGTDLENGKAWSRAKAKAWRVSDNMAEVPVKNWIKKTQKNMPRPPA